MIYTERFPCKSCVEIIQLFNQKFPNIRLGVYYSYEDDEEKRELFSQKVQALKKIGVQLSLVRKLPPRKPSDSGS